MFGLIAVLIFFMFRNGKKRQAAMQALQNGLRPGAEVMLQSGIFGTVVSIDDEDNRLTVQSGTSTIVVHRNAVSQIITPVDAPDDDVVGSELAPDDDPAFGERIAEERAAAGEPVETTEVVEEIEIVSDPASKDAAAKDSAAKESDGENGPETTPKA
ncbi:preprotein translocase subunit YajC [Leucobacter rhizosphaerae]|uniref:Preprotein translocase subunit YajC n=1 Tax=Leucobacter rhizosphaerae TaxID=2932245 RepID=A0ABY4FX05_9MICO|nr:preprotein translocase subunit YajC [Leucobacter rhizosphaerae]UOQ60797.1 preprotein translocase subunit YajC [Leucobacter rhizosphaerae]